VARHSWSATGRSPSAAFRRSAIDRTCDTVSAIAVAFNTSLSRGSHCRSADRPVAFNHPATNDSYSGRPPEDTRGELIPAGLRDVFRGGGGYVGPGLGSAACHAGGWRWSHWRAPQLARGALLVWHVEQEPSFAAAGERRARRDLAKLVGALEAYRDQQGHYPARVAAFTELPYSLRLINIHDLSAGVFARPREYQYELALDGQTYALAAVGMDGEPGTSDDVYPDLRLRRPAQRLPGTALAKRPRQGDQPGGRQCGAWQPAAVSLSRDPRSWGCSAWPVCSAAATRKVRPRQATLGGAHKKRANPFVGFALLGRSVPKSSGPDGPRRTYRCAGSSA
jgi:hypothetical protein